MYGDERSGKIIGIDNNKLYARMHALEREDKGRISTSCQHEVMVVSRTYGGKVDVSAYRDSHAYFGVGGAHPQCQRPSAGLDKTKNGWLFALYVSSTSLPFNRHIIG